MKSLGFVLLVAACGFKSGASGADPVDGSVVDSDNGNHGGRDSGVVIDAFVPPDAQECFGKGLLTLCLGDPPTGDKTLSTDIDTGNAGNCTKTFSQTNGPDLCVIAAKTITVNATVNATGTRALVLIAADKIDVQGAGTLDVSSRTNTPTRKGAAADATTCTAAGNGMNDSGGSGGGAGGSFGTQGGKGGLGDTNDSGKPDGMAPGGNPGATQTPTVLRGGCKGGAGGNGQNDGNPAHNANNGGEGGGAVYLIAGNTITISGNVFASGAGGNSNLTAGGAQQGGGGGGTGGMIGLDAPTITATGHVVANGGAGAGGGADLGGTHGSDGSTTDWNTRQAGGVGDHNINGDGGTGAQSTVDGTTTNLDGGMSSLGGGGGAGGLGVIMSWGTLTGTMISPAPIKN